MSSFRVFFASAFGAGVGALVALQSSPSFAWVGAIIGFALGYLSYEAKKVVAALPGAYRAGRRGVITASSAPSHLRKNISLLARWFLALDWKSARYLLYGLLSIASTAAVGFLLARYINHLFASQGNQHSVESTLLGILPGIFFPAAFIGAMMFVTAAFALFFGSLGDLRHHIFETREQRQSELWDLARAMTPIGVVFHAARYTCLFVRFSAPFGKAFTIYLFKQIHSDMRLLCATDAMIGAGIGYFAGSALIGAVSGGLIGLINYELVSKRWLKLTSRS